MAKSSAILCTVEHGTKKRDEGQEDSKAKSKEGWTTGSNKCAKYAGVRIFSVSKKS
jgi:hypothetical protein